MRLSAIAREPVVQFVAIGLALWLIVGAMSSEPGRYRIEVGPSERARLAQSYALQFGAPPTSAQLKTMVDRFIDDEIAYREGVAMGLGQNDEIVRRRIIEKFHFLTEDQSLPRQPSDAELQRWYSTHQERYKLSPRITFSHIYFSPDTEGELAARAQALSTLKKLDGSSGVATKGDEFPGPSSGAELSYEEVVRIFGRSEVSTALFNVPPGRWAGPFRSGYGWHLVRVSTRLAVAYPRFADIRDQLREDYSDEKRQQANRAAMAKLRSRYTVVGADRLL